MAKAARVNEAPNTRTSRAKGGRSRSEASGTGSKTTAGRASRAAKKAPSKKAARASATPRAAKKVDRGASTPRPTKAGASTRGGKASAKNGKAGAKKGKAAPLPPAYASGRYLIKSEPSVYPFEQLVADGKTAWEGVRNFEARNHLRSMKKGDLALYYHSNEGKEIVGIARVVREAYQDPTTTEDWSVVDFEPVRSLARPVTLSAIKADPFLSTMLLVRRSRISVVPMTEAEWNAVLAAAAS